MNAATETAQKPAMTIEVAALESTNGIGYRYKVTIGGDDENQQRVYDWTYGKLGHNAERWSISGDESFYVANEADAQMIKDRFDGTPQT